MIVSCMLVLMNIAVLFSLSCVTLNVVLGAILLWRTFSHVCHKMLDVVK